MTKLEQLQSLDNKVLQHFLKTRESSSLSPEMQEYILMINSIASIIHFEGCSQTRVCRALQREFPCLSYTQARNIFYDAMNFFYIDDNVTAEAWDNHYADKMEDLSRLAIAQNRSDIALKAMEKAHELRIKNRDIIKPQDWTPPVFIISGRISPEQLGFKKQDIFEVQRRKEDRLLSGLIKDLPTTEKEKARLYKEAGIETIEPEKDSSEDDDTTE